MTVSPKWPQDGNRQPSVCDNGVESGNSTDSAALPPTLFELPNLNQPAPQQVSTGSQVEALVPASQTDSSVSEPTEDSKSQDDTRPPIPPAVVAGVAAVPPAAPATAQTRVVDGPVPGPGQRSSSPIPQESTPTDRIRSQYDQPAGRTWMETIGSHSVVVVLLLIVIASGLLIGRNSGDKEGDAALADSSDLLDFDEGTEFELPLPQHGAAPHVDYAVSAEGNASGPHDSPEPIKADASDLASEMGVSDSSSPVAGTDDGSQMQDRLANSETQVDAAINDQGLPQDASRIEVNKVNDGSSNVDFMAASSRIPTATSLDALPTLEELAGESTVPGPQAAVEEASPTPRLSKTPAPIADWHSYLPTRAPGSADATVPFTSN